MNEGRLSAANAVHRRLLETWRKAMDLVGPGPVEPHFVDAVGAVRGLLVSGEWADLGSGAGFPGIALGAAYPEAQVTLVESREKRSVFLERVVAEAGLANVRVRCGRTEALPRGHWDGLISRAYKPPAELLPEAEGLLKVGGTLVVLLGSEASLGIPKGWSQIQTITYSVPDGQRQRVCLRWDGPLNS